MQIISLFILLFSFYACSKIVKICHIALLELTSSIIVSSNVI